MNIVKQKRIKKGMTRKEVAAYLGLSLSKYNYYEEHIMDITIEMMLNLSNFLMFDIKNVLEENDEKMTTEV